MIPAAIHYDGTRLKVVVINENRTLIVYTICRLVSEISWSYDDEMISKLQINATRGAMISPSKGSTFNSRHQLNSQA